MKKDIFDFLMEKRCFRILNLFYTLHKEVLLYLFFGGLSFFVNVSSFLLLNSVFCMGELWTNVIAWTVTVVFVYVTNKLWVFKVELHTGRELFLQIASFFAGRLGTLALEEAIIFIFITKLKLNTVVIKIVAQIVVIITNYVISKLLVFRKGEKNA